MPGNPHSGSKVWKAPDREISEPGENRGKVIAHRDLQPTAAFHDRCFKRQQVKTLSPSHRLVIALHSPDGVVKTGLPMCPPEKKGRKTCFGSKARHFLLSGLSATSEELRPFPAIFRSTQASFSALQTAWRRERDSNPRYPFGYIGFQDRLFQPLTHPSAAIES